jgi:hypothetical protein
MQDFQRLEQRDAGADHRGQLPRHDRDVLGLDVRAGRPKKLLFLPPFCSTIEETVRFFFLSSAWAAPLSAARMTLSTFLPSASWRCKRKRPSRPP